MSTHVWKSLNQDEQIWLQSSIDESVIYQRKLWLEATKKALDHIKNAGVEVIYPDKKLFQESVKKMYDNYKDESFYKLITKIKNHI